MAAYPDIMSYKTRRIDDIKMDLRSSGKSSLGSDLVIRARYYRHLCSATAAPPAIQHLVVLDFDATCQVGPRPGTTRQEIIKFSANLIDIKQGRKIDTFLEYCKPVHDPVLTPFCVDLTGIAQETVDAAETFPHVFQRFEAWLVHHGLMMKTDWCIVCDGPTHTSIFLFAQCKLSGIPYPEYAKVFTHVRRVFKQHYISLFDNRKWGSLEEILGHLGQPLQLPGGMDGTGKIGRVCLEMAQDGADFHPTDRVLVNERRPGREFGENSACRDVEISPIEWRMMEHRYRVRAA